MKIYEVESGGKRSKYRSLELAKAALNGNGKIYEIEINERKDRFICEITRTAKLKERLVFAK